MALSDVRLVASGARWKKPQHGGEDVSITGSAPRLLNAGRRENGQRLEINRAPSPSRAGNSDWRAVLCKYSAAAGRVVPLGGDSDHGISTLLGGSW